MADAYIQIPTDGTGKKVRTQEITVGADSVHTHYYILTNEAGEPATVAESTQFVGDVGLDLVGVPMLGKFFVGGPTPWEVRVPIVDSSDRLVVAVTSFSPTVTIQDGGNIITVDGTVTANLNNVDSLTIGQQTTAGTPAGVTVSTAATLLKASNASRKAILITNNSTGDLYLGHTAGVTTSGATMGLKIKPNGTYTDSGPGLYTGDIYAIYSVVAASQNVSVSERT